MASAVEADAAVAALGTARPDLDVAILRSLAGVTGIDAMVIRSALERPVIDLAGILDAPAVLSGSHVPVVSLLGRTARRP
jgi:hypothetical protein